MNHYTTKLVPEHEEKVLDFVTCDFCGKRKQEGKHDIDRIIINRQVGKEYPEGGSGVETAVDMCGECFETKLIPWIVGQGVTPTVEEWEW